tara:strand:- start:79 stop:546 length:468 start_codon:yes stop_codon:yes gene_type:complete
MFGKENKLFWDGGDWNQVAKSVKHDYHMTFKIKKAYLNGVLDGRLFSYLKVWKLDQDFADETFSETVDYLNTRELIKNIDYLYKDPLNKYIPIPSAILIANMYAKRLPSEKIELYILSTRRWINDLAMDLDTLNYTKLLDQKWLKHKDKQFNQSE